MNKKAKIIIAILILIFLGLIIFAFASPKDDGEGDLDNRVKQGEVDKKPSKDTDKESEDEKKGKEETETTKKEETPAKEEKKEEKPAEDPSKDEPQQEDPSEDPSEEDEEVDEAAIAADALIKRLESMIANAKNRSNIESAKYYEENAGIEELIAEVKDAEEKAALQERLDACDKILNAKPATVNLETGALLNEDTAIEVESDIKVTLTLSKDGEEAVSIENGFVVEEDGNYVLTITDEAYNEPIVIEFTMDQTPATVDVNYSEEKTNQPVVVTITSNEELTFDEENNDWVQDTTVEEGFVYTKTYNENIEESFVVTDKAGNETTVEFTIDTINVEKPVISNVEYSTEDLINGNVTVTITVSKELASISANWNPVAGEENTYAKVFETNVTDEEVVLTDLFGNVSEGQKVTVSNIDKTAPVITLEGVSKDDSKPANGNVTVKVEEENLSSVTYTLTKTADLRNPITGTVVMTENVGTIDLTGVEGGYVLTVTATDLVNLTDEETVRFGYHDGSAPVITGVTDGLVTNKNYVRPYVSDSYETLATAFGAENVSYTLTKNGKAVTWSNYDKISSEGVYVLTATDLAGNQTVVNFTIDRTAPAVVSNGIVYETVDAEGKTAAFNPANWSNKNVKVTITLTEAIDATSVPTGWTLDEETSKVLTKVFNSSAAATSFKVKDLAGNVSSNINVSALKVDTVAPVVTSKDTNKPMGSTKRNFNYVVKEDNLVQIEYVSTTNGVTAETAFKYAKSTNSVTVPTAKEGTYTIAFKDTVYTKYLAVKLTDAAGNVTYDLLTW